jgi:hypothetical protein
MTTAGAAAAGGVPGARLDIVADHVHAIGADGVGSQLTDVGRDGLALLIQRRGLPVQRGIAGSIIRRCRCLRGSQAFAALASAALTCDLKVALRSKAIVAMAVTAPTTTTAAATAKMLRIRRRFLGGAGNCSSFTVLPLSLARLLVLTRYAGTAARDDFTRPSSASTRTTLGAVFPLAGSSGPGTVSPVTGGAEDAVRVAVR